MNILILVTIFLFSLSIVILYYRRELTKQNKEIDRKIYSYEKYKENYLAIIDNDTSAIIIWDNKHVITEWNKASERIFGWTKEEVVGKKNIYLVIPDFLKVNFINYLKDLKNMPKLLSNNNITKSKELITCEWTNTIITNSSGEIVKIISIGQNIDEKIASENKLTEQKKELEINSEKLEGHIEDLETSNKHVKELSNKLEKIIELTGSLYESTLHNEEEFLSNLLHAALLLISEADYGSVYVYKNGTVHFIDSVGHDLNALKEISIDSAIFVKPTDEIIFIDNVVEFTMERISDKIKDKFTEASKPIKQTLKFDLYVNDELTAGVSLDIATENEKEFNENSKKTMFLFRNFANAFFTIQRYGHVQREFQKEIIFSIIQLLEIHDNYTKNHSHNVAILSEKIAKELNLTNEEINDAYWAGLVHDIGKILIPFDILNKKDRLTDVEFEYIKKHPYWGYITLSQTNHLNEIAKYVLYHHEYWDGSGYPEKVKEKEIPLISQIITVADSWDAMRSDRSYRSRLTSESALNEILNQKGIQFSPIVVDAFIKVIEREEITIAL